MDDFLNRLQQSGIGCYIGRTYAGVYGYVDVMGLLAPSLK